MEEVRAKLLIDDKRHLFQVLLGLSERLLMLNKFPVRQQNFALSCVDPNVEEAWRLLMTTNPKSLSPTAQTQFVWNESRFNLHSYPDEKNKIGQTLDQFMPLKGIKHPLTFDSDNRFATKVSEWCRRQIKLEAQLWRTADVIKQIVLNCNTVGQYRRVSPDILAFLPQKYRDALKNYAKQSPYPNMEADPEAVETTMANLAYASLQPEHYSETDYLKRMHWPHRRYNLVFFPRTTVYDRHPARSLGL